MWSSGRENHSACETCHWNRWLPPGSCMYKAHSACFDRVWSSARISYHCTQFVDSQIPIFEAQNVAETAGAKDACLCGPRARVVEADGTSERMRSFPVLPSSAAKRSWASIAPYALNMGRFRCPSHGPNILRPSKAANICRSMSSHSYGHKADSKARSGRKGRGIPGLLSCYSRNN
jgi:hypothetical protein